MDCTVNSRLTLNVCLIRWLGQHQPLRMRQLQEPQHLGTCNSDWTSGSVTIRQDYWKLTLTDAVDRAGMTAFQDATLLEPARQLILIVSQHPGLAALVLPGTSGAADAAQATAPSPCLSGGAR